MLGISTRKQGQRLRYYMWVDETLSFDEYWTDRRFRRKRPLAESRRRVDRVGDNCYEPLGNGRFRQVRGSGHWNHVQDRENPAAMRHDLNGKQVLVGRTFGYFGAEALRVPARLGFMMPARYHRVRFTEHQEKKILAYVQPLSRGIHGPPAAWESGDETWRSRAPRCV